MFTFFSPQQLIIPNLFDFIRLSFKDSKENKQVHILKILLNCKLQKGLRVLSEEKYEYCPYF